MRKRSDDYHKLTAEPGFLILRLLKLGGCDHDRQVPTTLSSDQRISRCLIISTVLIMSLCLCK